MARARRRTARRGNALILALIVVTFVTMFSVSMLRVSSSVTKRQSTAVDDKRAFYLAEAGLAEAYMGLQTGNSGQVGSLAAPALVGDGLCWVDSDWGEEGLVSLRSTGLCESGRATLELVVRRDTRPFGIFADEGIHLEVPFLLDGYDSETSTYYEQAGLAKVDVWEWDGWYMGTWDPVDHVMTLHYDDDHLEFFYCDEWDLDVWQFYYTHKTVDVRKDRSALTSADAVAPSLVEVEASSEHTFDDFTTGGGGQLGSNGPISLSGDVTGDVSIFGDLVPGADQAAVLGEGVTVSGSIEARAAPIELAEAQVPTVTMLPGVDHTSLIPMVVPPGDVGYEHLHVGPDAEVVVQGPGNLVFGDLTLDGASLMTIENETGAANLFVTGALDFASGSRVETLSHDTANLSLQGGPSAVEFRLEGASQFHGMVYAPDSHVRIGEEFEIFGVLVGNTIDVAPYARLHFDSGVLGDSGIVPIPKLVSWSIEEIPAAVQQSRVNPFELLGLDRDTLASASDAQETVSWMIDCHYMDHAGATQEYVGPIEQLDYAQVKYWTLPLPKLTPPEASLSEPWTIHIEYRTLFGWPGEYTGTMETFVSDHVIKVYYVDLLSMTPPPELQ